MPRACASVAICCFHVDYDHVIGNLKLLSSFPCPDSSTPLQFQFLLFPQTISLLSTGSSPTSFQSETVSDVSISFAKMSSLFSELVENIVDSNYGGASERTAESEGSEYECAAGSQASESNNYYERPTEEGVESFPENAAVSHMS